MRVTALRLEGFRNIERTELRPGGEISLFYGDNAQGKTNLLEAIWLFCGARSFRGAKDADYIAFGGRSAQLELEFTAQGREQTARIRFEPERKSLWINEIRQERVSLLASVFCAVIFSPDHLELVKQGPGRRRRMIDQALAQAYPKYAAMLDRYEQILRQRSALLRDAASHSFLLDTLDAWDESFVHSAAYIVWMRSRYIAALARHAGEIYEGISGGREQLAVAYRPSFGEVGSYDSRDQVYEPLAAAVRQGRAEDLRLGMSTVGPHRDEVDITLSGKSARSFGSQGQQRSCVLALKLAECKLLENSRGEAPVVLLDDVMSELDEGRRGYLLGNLLERQVFMTCCDASVFAEPGRTKVFEVRAGRLSLHP